MELAGVVIVGSGEKDRGRSRLDVVRPTVMVRGLKHISRNFLLLKMLRLLEFVLVGPRLRKGGGFCP